MQKQGTITFGATDKLKVDYHTCSKKQKRIIIDYVRKTYSMGVINVRDIINGDYFVYMRNNNIVATGFKL